MSRDNKNAKLPKELAGVMQRKKDWDSFTPEIQELLKKIQGIGLVSNQPSNVRTVAYLGFINDRFKTLLQQKNDLTEDEKAYLFSSMEKMKDQKLKSIITGLIGWGDEERGEIETFLAVAIELMMHMDLKEIEKARDRIEMRYLLDNAPVFKPTAEELQTYEIKDKTM